MRRADRTCLPGLSISNRAAAVAEAYGPEEGLKLLDELESRGELSTYHLLPAALALVTNDAERGFLERELAGISERQRG